MTQTLETLLSALVALGTSMEADGQLAPGGEVALRRLPESVLSCMARVSELRRLDRLDPANDDDGNDTNEDA